MNLPPVKGAKKIKKTAPLDIAPLICALESFFPLSDGARQFFERHIIRMECSRNTILLHSGDICRYVYFMKKGIVRGFVKDGNKDITTWITAENELVSSIYSLDLGIPALENMQAIEDCEFLAMSSKHLKQLYQKHPEFNITARKLLQQYYRDAEKRALLIRYSNAAFKYRSFLTQYPHLANRVPLKHVSSFLGIAFETLSRVRKKMSSKVKPTATLRKITGLQS